MERRSRPKEKVKRWDGAARACSDWDALRRDPELWFRKGNCYVHLYGEGQSQRGPAFKVPMGPLLAAKCHPMIRQFISLDQADSPSAMFSQYHDLDKWHQLNPTRRVDLYIPAPASADTEGAYQYHLATRNLFAWVFRRSLVGQHLGAALIQLFDSMLELRNDNANHLSDLLEYLDEEGYLDVPEQPIHALAILRLAENFHIRDLYLDAFCHCVGMNDQLFSSPEYHEVSFTSRKLLRRARVVMDLKLGRGGAMLRSFLEEELSDSHLGLTAGERAHMERFRSFLMTFYMNKFGYYPPVSMDSRSTIFEPQIYHAMHEDFEALYELLVDVSFTSAGNSPTLAQGGVCTLQSVYSFDKAFRYKSLDHSLPLLPEMPEASKLKRAKRLEKGDKTKPERLLYHASLLKATNQVTNEILKNDLVRAYLKFEELSVGPSMKVDRSEKISVVDGRKVRWILIYSVLQVLRSCTAVPYEVTDTNVPYHLAVSTSNLPPWKEAPSHGVRDFSRRRALKIPSTVPSSTLLNEEEEELHEEESVQSTPHGYDIKPDVDYFAISRRQERAAQRSSSVDTSRHRPASRSMSFSRSLSRNSTLRRSIKMFNRKTETEPVPALPAMPKKSAYHEIVVHGYGNGTNEVSQDDQDGQDGQDSSASRTSGEEQAYRTSSSARAMSTASCSSELSVTYSSDDTAESSPSTAPPATPKDVPALPMHFANAKMAMASAPLIHSPVPTRPGHRRVLSMSYPLEQHPALIQHRPSPSPPMSMTLSRSNTGGYNYAAEYEALVSEEYDRLAMSPPPLQIRKTFTVEVSSEPAPSGPEGRRASYTNAYAYAERDVKPVWEQFSDLGGLTSPQPARSSLHV